MNNLNTLYNDGRLKILGDACDVIIEFKRGKSVAKIQVTPGLNSMAIIACNDGQLHPRNPDGTTVDGVSIQCK